MATPNYSWAVPVVNGDNGAWGTILNGALTSVDATVKTVENKADLGITNAAAAQAVADVASINAQVALQRIADKVIVSTAAPTAANSADEGVIWCVV